MGGVEMNLGDFGGGQNFFQKIGALRAKIPSHTLFLPLFRRNFGGGQNFFQNFGGGVDQLRKFWGGCRPTWKILGGMEMEDGKNGGGGDG